MKKLISKTTELPIVVASARTTTWSGPLLPANQVPFLVSISSITLCKLRSDASSPRFVLCSCWAARSRLHWLSRSPHNLACSASSTPPCRQHGTPCRFGLLSGIQRIYNHLYDFLGRALYCESPGQPGSCLANEMRRSKTLSSMLLVAYSVHRGLGSTSIVALKCR